MRCRHTSTRFDKPYVYCYVHSRTSDGHSRSAHRPVPSFDGGHGPFFLRVAHFSPLRFVAALTSFDLPSPTSKSHPSVVTAG